jgi:glycosyltransferase involved in cell wall biosynthesis
MTAEPSPVPDGARRRRPEVDLEIIIPAADEQVRLGATLTALSSVLASLPLSTAVVVVDNASTDRTADVARSGATTRVPVHVVDCATRGKGFAVRAGVLTGNSRWIGFMDADLATDLAALPVVLAELQSGHPVVIGSRALATSQVTARHRAVRRLGAFAFRTAVSAVIPGVADTQCGFKFFDAHVARAVFDELVDGGFSFDVEVLARCRAAGADILEVPVSWVDQPGSTFRPTRDGWDSFLDVWRISRRMRGAALATSTGTGVPATSVGREAELATGA